ncbi:SDR family oxidoreductase [Hyphomicrobium sp.]|uniref:SDR family oxidoreductase n=1 Tax=Hyphomicrobium sp. TaxID=82 RepID=UPI000F939174|nr:SDR family oxidoreductase [Hyphomicrobium sp.]RUP07867.1 MAG: SDR family oxidoreductase [Hyphomicrobium sp.]
MSKPLSGKIAVVTGGSRGIGRGIAEKLAADGALVAVHYGKGKASADEVVAKIKSNGGDAFAVGADLAKKGAAQALFAGVDQELKQRTGDTKFDILVNNAGIAPFVGFDETTEDVLDEIFSVNVKSLFLITQEGSKRLKNGGRIVSTSSLASRLPLGAVAAYSMLKAPLDNLAKTLAVHLGPREITVNVVAPGVIETDMAAEFVNNAEGRAFAESKQALKRVGQPSDVADVVAFLAGPESRWVTGQVIEVAGGTGLTFA